MLDIIKNCAKKNRNGLMTLDMPTGFGKSYTAVEFISDAIINGNEARKIFFITTQKKNLPFDKLENKFKAAGKASLFEDICIRLDALYEDVIKGMNNNHNIEYNIPKELKDAFRVLKDDVELINSLEDSGNKKHLEKIKNGFRNNTEPAFRKQLQEVLFKKFKTPVKRLEAIKTNKEWMWAAKLYPTIFLFDKQIFFMSVDKFLLPNTIIVDSSFYLYDSDIIKDAIIFIDEFDATKDTVLKNLIQNCLRDKLDSIALFNAINAVLQEHKFTQSITKPYYKKVGQRSPKDLLDAMKDEAAKIYADYSLQYNYKTETITDRAFRNFLFQDHEYFSILSGDKPNVSIKTNRNQCINLITFTTEELANSNSNKTIEELLERIRQFNLTFIKNVFYISDNYRKNRNKITPSKNVKVKKIENSAKDEISLEEAVQTILSEFRLSESDSKRLTSRIMSYAHNVKINTGKPSDNFYDTGFRYYAFNDDFNHDTQSKIMMVDFNMTPEKFMLQICKKALVFGMSATASIDSVLGNYDVKYFREKLGDKYIELNQDELSCIKSMFKSLTKGYSNIKIYAELIKDIDEKDYKRLGAAAWKELLGDAELAEKVHDMISLYCTTSEYYKARYLRIARVFKEFLRCKGIKSFLCLLTLFPREGFGVGKDSVLDWNILLDVFNELIKLDGGNDSISNVVKLDGVNYDSKKDEIFIRLSVGERLFVISTYQTIGAGQNLQYTIPDNVKNTIVKINNIRDSDEKDFDAIYLDMPTHIIVNSYDCINWTEEDFIKYLYQIEVLKNKCEISLDEARIRIKNAFAGKNKSKNKLIDLFSLDSYKRATTKILIQAIGRMCRTNNKSPNIYIFVDSRIVDRIDYSICKDKNRIMNHEFEALVDALEIGKRKRDEAARKEDAKNRALSDEAEGKSQRVHEAINNKLPGDKPWKFKNIPTWKDWRIRALKNPTMPAEMYEAEFKRKGVLADFFAKKPSKTSRVFYKQQNDFEYLDIIFSENERGNMSEISADACHLTAFMKLDYIRTAFKEKGYATEFKDDEYILCPTAYNNIYRGALGEEVGKILFEHECATVKLEEITEPEYFEKFDFRVAGTSIYIDFKNWHENEWDEEKILEHIGNKAAICNAKCVFIINIIANDTSWEIRKREINGVPVVMIPCLIYNKEHPHVNHKAFKEIRGYVRNYGRN